MIVRLGVKVPDDGSRWWQELPADTTAESARSVGYEVVEVIPISASLLKIHAEETRQSVFSTLLSDEAKAAALDAFERNRQKPTELAIADALQAAIEQVGGGPG